MSGGKRYLTQNVYDSSLQRIRFILEEFPHFYVSFSGGKDSGVMTQLILKVAAEMGIGPVPVLFYDWEAIYQETDAFVRRILSRPDVEPFWVCTPVTERNGSSLYEPFWRPWDKRKRELWIREYPDHPAVITEDNMPEAWQAWYDRDTHDQYFFIKFGDWFARTRGANKVANFVAIRVDESHDRYRMLKTRKNRIKHQDRDGKVMDWCYRYKANAKEVWYTMPNYDWRVEDVWACIGKEKFDYNHIYDRFWRMGIPLHDQRICNPYGEQQKRGLHQYHQCEPESWAKIVSRVSGANFGANYNKTKLTAGRIQRPEHLTWKQYLRVLLGSLPEGSRDHYRHIMARTLWWHRKRKRELGGQPTVFDCDALDHIPEGGTKNDVVSYRLMCEVIIKGDYWGKKLCFAETKKEKERQAKLIKKYEVI